MISRWARVTDSDGAIVYWHYRIDALKRLTVARVYRACWRWTLYTSTDGHKWTRMREGTTDSPTTAKRAAENAGGVR